MAIIPYHVLKSLFNLILIKNDEKDSSDMPKLFLCMNRYLYNFGFDKERNWKKNKKLKVGFSNATTYILTHYCLLIKLLN